MSRSQGYKKVSVFCGQQVCLPIHLSTLRIGNFTSGVHQAFTPGRSSVKAARCEAARLHRRLADPCRYSWTGRTACPDDHQCAPVSRLDHQLREVGPNAKSWLPVHREAVQHSTVRSGAPIEDASQSPVCSPTLDDQPNHHGPRSSQIAGRGGVYGFTGTAGKTPSSSGPVVGCHSWVPEDDLVRQDHSSSVGSVRGGLVGISSSPTRSSPCHQVNGSDSLHWCVQFGLGSPVRLTLDTGTVVSISGDAGHHHRCEGLPHLRSRVVHLMWDSGLHQERGRHTILHTYADDVAPAEVLRSQGNNFGSPPSTRSPQHPGRFPVQSWPDTDHGVDDGHGPIFAQWGEPQVDLFATFANRRLIKFASPYPDLRAEYKDAMSVPWDHGRGLLYAFPPFKMVPQVLQKVTQSPGVLLILIAPLQATASWFPELLELSHEDPIPLYVEGQPLLTQDVMLTDRVTDSSLPAVKSTRVETLRAILMAKGHSREAAEMMSRSLRESSLHVYESHWAKFVSFCRSKRWHVFRVRSHHFSTYMMHLFRDGLLPSMIISHHTSVASVLHHWVTIRQPTRTSSYSSELFGWNVQCNVESCPNGTCILCFWHWWDRHSHRSPMSKTKLPMTSFHQNGGPWKQCSC